MKTLFTRGFDGGSFRPFTMGQATVSQDFTKLLAGMQQTDSMSAAVGAWINANPNYASQMSSSDAAAFSQALTDSMNLAGTWTNIEGALQGNISAGSTSGDIDAGNYATIQQYQQDVSTMWNLMNQYQVQAGKPATPAPAAPAPTAVPTAQQPNPLVSAAGTAANVIPGLLNKPGTPAAKPISVPAPGPSPWLIGGAAVVGIGVLALVLTRR